MPILKFPDPRDTDSEGIVGVGGDLHPESLLLAYSQGIFPWPISGMPLAWFCPPERAILEFKDLHIPKSLRRQKNRAPFHFTTNKDFRGVIQGCAKTKRPGQRGTWITAAMTRAYTELHRLGFAQSIEAWEREALAGGLYGVTLNGVFSAESMFYTKPYASKLALLQLIENLSAQGIDWIDIQVMTPHMEALGAKLIPRDEFLDRLAQAQRKNHENPQGGPQSPSLSI